MSCLSFLGEAQRAALAASSASDADGAPLSRFASPPGTQGKRRRVERLADSGDPRIRESAALSYHAPPAVLAALAADPEVGVRACVARNEHTDAPLLRRLAADSDPRVRGWVAAHRHVEPDVRESLAADPHPQVRAVVAWARGWEQAPE